MILRGVLWDALTGNPGWDGELGLGHYLRLRGRVLSTFIPLTEIQDITALSPLWPEYRDKVGEHDFHRRN
jgi:hypothetical protein